MTRMRVLAVLVVLGFAALLAPPIAQANMAPPRDFVVGLTLEKTTDGPRIKTIEKGGAAEEAGLRVGDLILGIDQRYAKLMSDADLKAFAEDPHPWPFEIIIVRDGGIMTMRVSS